MAVLSGGGDGGKSFPTLGAVADAINQVTQQHGFRVSAGGHYVKCVPAGQPRGKENAAGRQQRDRKSQKCGCGFSLSVRFRLPLCFREMHMFV
jgi:hypothetical protein